MLSFLNVYAPLFFLLRRIAKPIPCLPSSSSLPEISSFCGLQLPNLPFLLAVSNANLKPGGPLKWKKRIVKDEKLSLTLTEAMKIVRLASPLSDMPRPSSPRPKLRHYRQFALLSHPNLTLILRTLSFVLTLALLSPLLISPTVLLPGSLLRSSPFTKNPTFLSPSQRLFVTEPEATFLSSAEPAAPRSFIHPFAPASPPLNFLQLSLISPRPLPLAQTKLPILC